MARPPVLVDAGGRTSHQKVCTKVTQRHKACGRELRLDGTCPGGFLHAEAPHYPRLWPAIAVASLGVLVLLAFLLGNFSFIGPFTSNINMTVGNTFLVQGSLYDFGKGQTFGLYELGGCRGSAANHSALLLSLRSGGVTVRVYPSRSQPSYNEFNLFDSGQSVQQCATFTTPPGSSWVTVTYVSAAARQLGLKSSSDLNLVKVYYGTLALILLFVLAACWYLARTLRRRHHASDPLERPDVTHDPIAMASKEYESFGQQS